MPAERVKSRLMILVRVTRRAGAERDSVAMANSREWTKGHKTRVEPRRWQTRDGEASCTVARHAVLPPEDDNLRVLIDVGVIGSAHPGDDRYR